jgi:hypothetical protein
MERDATKAQEVETQNTSISPQGVAGMGTEGTQEGDHQEQEELSEGEEVRQENRSMKQEDYERAVIIQTRIDQCNYILDMIEKSKNIRIAQGNRSMTIQDPGLVNRIIKDIKEHREILQCEFGLLGERTFKF